MTESSDGEGSVWGNAYAEFSRFYDQVQGVWEGWPSNPPESGCLSKQVKSGEGANARWPKEGQQERNPRGKGDISATAIKGNNKKTTLDVGV